MPSGSDLGVPGRSVCGRTCLQFFVTTGRKLGGALGPLEGTLRRMLPARIRAGTRGRGAAALRGGGRSPGAAGPVLLEEAGGSA